jgi:hypothetical protein
MTRNKFQYNFNNSLNSKSFDYSKNGELFKRTVSKALYSNVNMKNYLDHLSLIFSHVINSVKNIKRRYMYSVDSEYENFD